MEKLKSDTEIVEGLCYYLFPALHCIFLEVESETHVIHLQKLLDFLESAGTRIGCSEDEITQISLRVWDKYLSNTDKALFMAALGKISEMEEDDDLA